MADNKYRLPKWAHLAEVLEEGQEPQTGVAYINSTIDNSYYIEYSQPVKAEILNTWLLALSNMARSLVKFGFLVVEDIDNNDYINKKTLVMQEYNKQNIDGATHVIDSVEPSYTAFLVMRDECNPRKEYKADNSDLDKTAFYAEATDEHLGYINNSICLKHFPLITRATNAVPGCFRDDEYNMNASFQELRNDTRRYVSYAVNTPNQKTTPLPKLKYSPANLNISGLYFLLFDEDVLQEITSRTSYVF